MSEIERESCDLCSGYKVMIFYPPRKKKKKIFHERRHDVTAMTETLLYAIEVMRGREKLMKNSNENEMIHQIIIQKTFLGCVVFAEKCTVNEEIFFNRIRRN